MPAKRTRGGSTGSRPPRDEVLERQHKALTLRLAGATWQQVADGVGYSDRSNARKAVVKALEEQVAEDVDQLRAVQGARYERLIRAGWTQALAGDTQHMDRVLAAMRDYNRLMGLNMPTRLEVTSEMDAEIERLVAALADEEGAYQVTDLEGGDLTPEGETISAVVES